jgi:integrase
MAGIKQGTKQGLELTTKEVLGWAGKAAAGDILRAGKGLYLRKTTTGCFWFFRFASPVTGKQVRVELWADDPRGLLGFPDATLAEAKAKTVILQRDIREGIDPVLKAEQERQAAIAAAAAEAAAAEAEQRRLAEAARLAELEQQRRITVRQLFARWKETDLQPMTLKGGERQGRKDGGALIEQQFSKHLFPVIGDRIAEEVRRGDVMEVLDKIKAKGLNRTVNMVLSSLRQMFTFALVREIVRADPTYGIKKGRDGGGKDVERDRALSAEEIKLLATLTPTAKLNQRTEAAIWLMLATGCRIGELMGAAWADAEATRAALNEQAEKVNAKVGTVDMAAGTWEIFDTKNQQDHLIHLSGFALTQFKKLAELREVGKDGKLTPWVFPNSTATGPVCTKSINKQLQDRQRDADKRMSGRAKNTTALLLPGGQWTPHDLRRTAATLMSRAGVNVAVIHRCLNHKPQDKLDRIYIQDDRMEDRQRAFEALGDRLAEITSGKAAASNVIGFKAA